MNYSDFAAQWNDLLSTAQSKGKALNLQPLSTAPVDKTIGSPEYTDPMRENPVEKFALAKKIASSPKPEVDLTQVPDPTWGDPSKLAKKIAKQQQANANSTVRANAPVAKSGGSSGGLGGLFDKIKDVSSTAWDKANSTLQPGLDVANEIYRQTGGRVGATITNPMYELVKSGHFWEGSPQDIWDAVQSGESDAWLHSKPIEHGVSDMLHEGGLLQDVNGAPWWQKAITRAANYIVSVGGDIALNPASYAGAGIVGEGLKGASLAENAGTVGASVGRGADLAHAIENDTTNPLTAAEARRVISSMPEPTSRQTGGLPFTHRESPQERAGLAANMGVAAYEKADQEIQKYSELIAKNPNTKKKPPPGWDYIKSAEKEKAAEIAAYVETPSVKGGGVATQPKRDFIQELADAREGARRAYATSVGSNARKTTAEFLDRTGTQGNVVLNIRAGLPLSTKGGKQVNLGGEKISKAIYKLGAKATDIAKTESIGLPGATGRMAAAEAAGKHVPWALRTHTSPIAKAIGLVSNNQYFPNRVNAIRQEVMSKSAQLLQEQFDHLKMITKDLSPDDQVRIRQAINGGHVSALEDRLQKPANDLQQLYNDLHETEVMTGIRTDKNVNWDRYTPLYLGGGTGGDKGTRKEFLNKRKAAIQSGNENEIAKYSWESAQAQGLRPSNDLVLSTGHRIAKTMSQLEQAGFTNSMVGQFGMFGNFDKAAQKELGIVPVQSRHETYIKAIANGTKDGQRLSDPNVHVYLPEALSHTHDTIEALLRTHNPYDIAALTKMYDTVLSQWKFAQTVASVPAQSRNFLTDVMTAFMDGVSPTQFLRHKAQYDLLDSQKIARPVVVHGRNGYKVSVPFDRVEGFFKNNSNIGLTSSDQLRSNVASAGSSTGLISGKLGRTPSALVAKTMTAGHNVREKLLDIADRREKFARSVHFHAAFKQELEARVKSAQRKGWKPSAADTQVMITDSLHAAQNRVNKFHVDYTNSTPWELSKARRWMSFYTYMRGIIPTIMEQSLLNPGRINALDRTFANLPTLFGRQPGSDSTAIIPPYRAGTGGVQLDNSQEPSWFDNNLNPLGTVNSLLGGDVKQNIYGKLNPLAQIGIGTLSGKNAIGQNTDFGKSVGAEVPWTGDNPLDKLRSRLPPLSTNPEDYANYVGAGIKTIKGNEQLATLKDQNKAAESKIAQQNQYLLTKGFAIEKVANKQQWVVHRVDPETGKIKSTSGKYSDPGLATIAAYSMAG